MESNDQEGIMDTSTSQTNRIEVWQDGMQPDGADAWIVSAENGDSSTTLAVADTQADADRIAAAVVAEIDRLDAEGWAGRAPLEALHRAASDGVAAVAASKAAAALGRRGGKAGRGESQRRGNSEHYRRLGERAAMGRAITSWHKDQVGSLTVWWIDGTEGTGRRICSIHDAESHEPATRLLRDGTRERLDGEVPGLTVYGTHKWDRPTLDEWPALCPTLAHLADWVRGL
jgi:hypothetical protein